MHTIGNAVAHAAQRDRERVRATQELHTHTTGGGLSYVRDVGDVTVMDAVYALWGCREAGLLHRPLCRAVVSSWTSSRIMSKRPNKQAKEIY
jgi:hypothetical protein